MKRKERIEKFVDLTIDSLGLHGVAVGRLDGIVHFVKGALPGETIRARVLRDKKRYVECELDEVLTPSEFRIQAPCPHFGECGGCSWQHFVYEQQADWKRQHVVDSFKHIAGVDVGVIAPTISAAEPYGYRNKMEFSFSSSKWLTKEEIGSGAEFDTSFALGLHVPGRFDKVRDLDHCLIQAPIANEVLKAVHALADRIEVSAYDHRAHVGFLRHLVLRTSRTTGSIIAVLITTTPDSDDEAMFLEEWMKMYDKLPDESTIMHAVNDTHSPVANGQILQQNGIGYLTEKSHGVEFRISPFSFFQTNTQQMTVLIDEMLRAASLHESDVIWDLYCGTGTLSLPSARLVKRVVGAELFEASILDARSNAKLNGIDNAEFHVVDLHAPKALPILQAFPKPDVVVVDPPRNGMHTQVVEHLLAIAPKRIAYVSCNPATLARDCGLLAEKYSVEYVQPVDMFPQTFHVEAVARLLLKELSVSE